MTGVKMQRGKLDAIQRYRAMAAVVNDGVGSDLKSVGMNSCKIRKIRSVQLDDVFGGVVVRNLVAAEGAHEDVKCQRRVAFEGVIQAADKIGGSLAGDERVVPALPSSTVA